MSSVFIRSRPFVLALALGATLLAGACGKKREGGEAAKDPVGSAAAPATPATPPTPPTPSAPVATGDQIAVTSLNLFFKAADGTVKVWGFPDLLPDLAPEARSKPNVVPDLAKTKRMSIGGGQTVCAVMMDGTAKCWGNGASGELGDGKENKSVKPVVIPVVSNASAIGVGDYYACALIGDGTVQCWGNNSNNRSSVDAKDKFITPTAMPGVTGAQQIAVGGDTACALGANGSVTCWGDSCAPDGGDCKKPHTIASLAGATNIGAGWETLCAVVKEGVQCWGRSNEYGQLGTGGTETDNKIAPVKGLTGVKEVAAGQQHWCALMKDGTVQCWGSNEFGQLGDGSAPETEKFRATPAPVKGIADAVSLSCNSGTCCVQVKDKSVKCWGENGGNALFGDANSSTTNFPTPVAVPVN